MGVPEIDQILGKLVKDVEASVHSLYRGEVRPETTKARTGRLLEDARAAVAAVVTPGPPAAVPGAPDELGGRSPRPSVGAPVVAGVELGWTSKESEAVMKCINAWLPMGNPASAAPDSRCIAAGKMLVPTWAEREEARQAVRKIARP